jgi:hypothetical protein
MLVWLSGFDMEGRLVGMLADVRSRLSAVVGSGLLAGMWADGAGMWAAGVLAGKKEPPQREAIRSLLCLQLWLWLPTLSCRTVQHPASCRAQVLSRSTFDKETAELSQVRHLVQQARAAEAASDRTLCSCHRLPYAHECTRIGVSILCAQLLASLPDAAEAAAARGSPMRCAAALRRSQVRVRRLGLGLGMGVRAEVGVGVGCGPAPCAGPRCAFLWQGWAACSNAG